MGNRAFKDQLYAQFARLGAALSNPHRVELLDLLTQGERPVDDLARETSLTVANASQHLQVLRGAQLVIAEKRGLRVFYRVADPAVLALWHTLRSTGERQLAEIDRLVDFHLGYRRDMEAIGQEELLRRVREGTVTVIDTRPRTEYEQGHIAGAISMPVADLLDRLEDLPDDRPVVAYCRGPYCVYADEAVALLTAHGRPAFRLEDGYPEWSAAGLPSDGAGRLVSD